MTPTRGRSPHRRAAALATIVAVAALATLGGCSPASTGGSAAQSTGTESGPQAPLDQIDVLEDLRGHVGGSSARIVDSAVKPITAAPAPQLPVTITDSQGTEVTVTDVSRILTLDVYGSLSRTVFELGLGANVIGRDTSSTFAEIEGLPLVTGNGHEVTAEAILELAPSVILTDTSIGPWDVILQMRDAGIPVVVVSSERTLASTPSLIQQVADALGVSADGKALVERTQAQVDATLAQIAAIAPQAQADKLRMMFLYVRGQSGVYYMFGQGSGADSLIEAVGGYDISAEIGWDGMRPVNDEGLIAAQPDLIIMMTKGLESVDGVEGLLERLPAIAQTPAGLNRRIVDMPDTQVMAFGPQTAKVLDALARAVYAPGEST